MGNIAVNKIKKKQRGFVMLKILISLGIGFLIGYQKFLSDKMIAANSKLQMIWLLLLIFVMGMSIGMDPDILTQLPVLGGKAFIFAVATCVGSVGVVYIFSRIFFKEEKK